MAWSISSLFSLTFGGFLKNFVMNIFQGFVQLFWDFPPEPVLDVNQIQLIRNSWQKLENSNLQAVGVLLFKRLFEIAPYLRDRFPFGYSTDSKALNTHALGVMTTLGVAVNHLENPDGLKTKLIELGAVHKSFELTDREFQNVGAALLWTLEQGLREEFTPEVKNAWVAVFGLIQENMKEGLQ